MPDTAQPRQIKIFDTTLRDGEQSPGCSMNLQEKTEVAQALVDLGVDIIEAGFPIASPGDFEAVREIANTMRGNSVIAGLARCNDADIDRAWEALKRAPRARIRALRPSQRGPCRVTPAARARRRSRRIRATSPTTSCCQTTPAIRSSRAVIRDPRDHHQY